MSKWKVTYLCYNKPKAFITDDNHLIAIALQSGSWISNPSNANESGTILKIELIIEATAEDTDNA